MYNIITVHLLNAPGRGLVSLPAGKLRCKRSEP